MLLLLRRRRQIYIHCTIGLARIYSRMGRHAAALSLLRATGYEYRRLHSQGLVSAAVVSAVFSHNSAQLLKLPSKAAGCSCSPPCLFSAPSRGRL